MSRICVVTWARGGTPGEFTARRERAAVKARPARIDRLAIFAQPLEKVKFAARREEGGHF
jgi:hypothetical protein